MEATLWNEAHAIITQHVNHFREPEMLPQIPGQCSFTDGSWKKRETYSGQGRYSTLEGFYGLMEARNTRASLSPFIRKWKLSSGKYNA